MSKHSISINPKKEVYPASDVSHWWLTVPPVGARSHPHNVRVDSTRHTVLHLSIELWQSVFYISQNTHSHIQNLTSKLQFHHRDINQQETEGK